MKPVERHEILDYVTYGEQREAIRARALEAKRLRRILVGEPFAFLFENWIPSTATAWLSRTKLTSWVRPRASHWTGSPKFGVWIGGMRATMVSWSSR